MSQNQIPFYYNFHYIFNYIFFSCESGPRYLRTFLSVVLDSGIVLQIWDFLKEYGYTYIHGFSYEVRYLAKHLNFGAF